MKWTAILYFHFKVLSNQPVSRFALQETKKKRQNDGECKNDGKYRASKNGQRCPCTPLFYWKLRSTVAS